ncbi:MAG: tRNA threonylcarbamoyladenosine biosynthesis protein TsaB [Clostridia bacterium]|jgi:tRNA threonylcarbamoyladenosine biosynthesis protein TsaB|nr:tRNA threonylcarbamoyladenosine biosynthesis protein TsaB [Clostridia bacterium]MDN5322787.1 tRNA threonylcarbamoyladenosine biosynthesis protein TsaB [Clostridia bacterium]
MIILSIDSSTPVAGVAIVDKEKIWVENFLNTGYTHSEQLLPLIKQTLDLARLRLKDVTGIAVTKGPGSFTGLRIGLATAKSLAQVTGIKLIGIPTLDALAQNLFGIPGIICPILNARKQEVYTALYEMHDNDLIRISDYLAISPEKLAEELSIQEKPVTFLGDGVFEYKEVINSKLLNKALWAPLNNLLPRAASVAVLGLKQLEKGQENDLFALEPFYLRKSEAEIKWEAARCQR